MNILSRFFPTVLVDLINTYTHFYGIEVGTVELEVIMTLHNDRVLCADNMIVHLFTGQRWVLTEIDTIEMPQRCNQGLIGWSDGALNVYTLDGVRVNQLHQSISNHINGFLFDEDEDAIITAMDDRVCAYGRVHYIKNPMRPTLTESRQLVVVSDFTTLLRYDGFTWIPLLQGKGEIWSVIALSGHVVIATFEYAWKVIHEFKKIMKVPLTQVYTWDERSNETVLYCEYLMKCVGVTKIGSDSIGIGVGCDIHVHNMVSRSRVVIKGCTEIVRLHGCVDGKVLSEDRYAKVTVWA